MLGIDTSKKDLDCTLWDPHKDQMVWNLKVLNGAEGIDRLLRKTDPDIAWVIEPTGRYSTRVVEQAVAAGRRVLLAPPKKARMFLGSLQDRAKTDKIDSKGLARFGLSRPLAAYPLKDKVLDTLDQLLSARKGISTSISKLLLQSQELPAAREVLLGAISLLKGELKALDQKIRQTAAAEPKVAIAKELLKVPGIGAVTSVAVASRLASKNFSHPDQFVAYLGLDIGVSESGQHKGKRGLTHQGDAELRRLLYCCAQSSLRCKDPVFRDQYDRERAKGLPTTAALCAVARKMARLCWSLHKHNGVYDADRVYKQPDRKRVRPESETPENPNKNAPTP